MDNVVRCLFFALVLGTVSQAHHEHCTPIYVASSQNASHHNENSHSHEASSSLPMDCEELLRRGYHHNGVYKVWPRNRIMKDQPVFVYCDMVTDGGGWTVFQRRGFSDRAKDFFHRGWNQYKNGFGTPATDYWLGNDALFAITNQRRYSLMIDLVDFTEKRYALYDSFWIDNEENGYTLHVDYFSGNAGDSFIGHNNHTFSTMDKDNDVWENSCAQTYKGGWWYTKCHSSNLNGLYLNGTHSSYADGVEWSTWKGQNYSLPFVQMKIRPLNVHVIA